MEGILIVGLQIPDAERVRAVHGDSYCRLLGSTVLHLSLHDHDEPPPPISPPSGRFTRATLRRRFILRDQHVRSLHFRPIIFETGSFIFLGIFRLSERFLDRYSFA